MPLTYCRGYSAAGPVQTCPHGCAALRGFPIWAGGLCTCCFAEKARDEAERPRNKQPCTVCGNTVKTFEGNVCERCNVALCGGNRCQGAHASECEGI